MHPASWSPPIPAGTPAVDAWKRLDRPTRRELLRSATAHPDPTVAAVAVGYARTTLGRRWWLHTLRQMAWLIPVLSAVAVTATILDVAWLRWHLMPVLAPPIVLLITFVWAVRLTRFKLALIRMENANAPGLLAAEAATSTDRRPEPGHLEREHVAGPSDRFAVRYDVKTLARLYGGAVAIAIAAVAVTLAIGNPIFYVPVIAAMALLTIFFAYNAIRWLRPRNAVAILDRQGVRIPSVGVEVAWHELSEIRILPLRAAPRDRPRSCVIAFVPVDAERFLDQMPARKARAAQRALRYYGSPLVLPDQVLRQSAHEIAAAARAFSTVPVRRFGA